MYLQIHVSSIAFTDSVISKAIISPPIFFADRMYFHDIAVVNISAWNTKMTNYTAIHISIDHNRRWTWVLCVKLYVHQSCAIVKMFKLTSILFWRPLIINYLNMQHFVGQRLCHSTEFSFIFSICQMFIWFNCLSQSIELKFQSFKQKKWNLKLSYHLQFLHCVSFEFLFFPNVK